MAATCSGVKALSVVVVTNPWLASASAKAAAVSSSGPSPTAT